MEGIVQRAGDVEYIFYNQLGGDQKRVDVFHGKSLRDIEEYKNYEILDSYPNGDRMTHYIKPKKESIVQTNDKEPYDKFKYKFGCTCSQSVSRIDMETGKKVYSYKTWIRLRNNKELSIEEWFACLDEQMNMLDERDIFENLLKRERSQPWSINMKEQDVLISAYASYSYRHWEERR